MPDVSPTKWHRAHTSWFFETFLLAPSTPSYREFHPAFSCALQLLLPGGRIALPARRAGTRLATGHPRDRLLSRTRRPGHARAARPSARRTDRVARRARHPPRAAASGTAADGHQARPLAEPAPAGVQPPRRGSRGPTPSPPGGASFPVAPTASATPVSRSASTTSSPATRCTSSPSPLPTHR